MNDREPYSSPINQLSSEATDLLVDLQSDMGFNTISPRDGSPPILDQNYVNSVTDETWPLQRETTAILSATGEFGQVLSGNTGDTSEPEIIEALVGVDLYSSN